MTQTKPSPSFEYFICELSAEIVIKFYANSATLFKGFEKRFFDERLPPPSTRITFGLVNIVWIRLGVPELFLYQSRLQSSSKAMASS